MIEIQDPSSHPPIWVDLDGTLVDFEMALINHYGIEPNRVNDDQLWEAINDYESREGREWFLDLPLMPRAWELWARLAPYQPGIITATGRNGEVHGPQKIRFCMQRLRLPREKIIVVRRSEDKAAHATPGAIIIDDNFERVIKTWEAAGGIGIHHIHTDRTLTLLDQIERNGWQRRPCYPLTRLTR